MNAPLRTSQPALDNHFLAWERRVRRIQAQQRADLCAASAAGTLTRARRLAIVTRTAGEIAEAGAWLIEVTARDGYPPAGRGGGEAS